MVGMVMLDFTGNGSLICASNSAQIAMHILKTDCNCIKIKTYLKNMNYYFGQLNG